jgi:hypothetical protein
MEDGGDAVPRASVIGLLAIVKLEDSDRADLESQRRQALAFEQSFKEWQQKYNSVIEYHTLADFCCPQGGAS